MKIILSLNFILVIVFIFPSCSESPKKKTVEVKFDAPIYDSTGNLFTGTKKETINGKTIEYDFVNGKKHGSFKIYYENGNLEMEGQIKENKNDGHWKYYYQDGTLESEGNFANDLIEGKWSWFYPTGKIKETAEYKNGLREGNTIVYDEDGKIISEKMYKMGDEVN
ncbi:MAG TPA: toxin-antitoxin system YwqK family antitoxin [Ignavibacteriaceae bacterium]|nr:toxin-antitoxin system YwqK family antitoxin [Ignavibacteriaceae bacterium]